MTCNDYNNNDAKACSYLVFPTGSDDAAYDESATLTVTYNDDSLVAGTTYAIAAVAVNGYTSTADPTLSSVVIVDNASGEDVTTDGTAPPTDTDNVVDCDSDNSCTDDGGDGSAFQLFVSVFLLLAALLL